MVLAGLINSIASVEDSGTSLDGKWFAEAIEIAGVDTLEGGSKMGLLPLSVEIKGEKIVLFLGANTRINGKIVLKTSKRNRELDVLPRQLSSSHNKA